MERTNQFARGLGMVALLGFVFSLGMSSPAVAQEEAIIIDHTCTNLDAIPDFWIEQAKQLTIHYAHTSHGSQVLSGARNLESLHPWYSIAVRASSTEGLPDQTDPPSIRVYDGNPPETYITPEDYWSTAAGRDRTRAVANTGNYDYSTWTWCGQASYYSDAQIEDYLARMDQFEVEYPAMRFIFMTGHTDGGGLDGSLNRHNNMIRTHCATYGKVLFDFADIESYNPDGEEFLSQGCDDYGNYDGGNWPAEWCADHPGDDLCDSCSCAHSQSLICNLKGNAFWWMMARLAGWDGNSWGDADEDGDVDLADYLIFADCMAGPGTPPSPTLVDENTCLAVFDTDTDDDVDMDDFSLIQQIIDLE